METLGVSAPSFTSSQMHDERPEETYAAPSSSKRRKSTAWNHFEERINDRNEKVAVCKYCSREFDGSSKKGTTHLNNHLLRCPKRESCPSLKDGETHKKMMSTCLETAGVGGDFVFDDERSRLDVARKIINLGYPLCMVEHLFQIFVENFQPSFKFWPRDALKDGILRVYEEEKKKLYEYLGTLSCHFNLIIQFRTCHRKKNVYCCFTLQFLENDMILKKKILALKKLDQYDDIAKETFFGRVTSLLQEWNIDKKLYSITLRSSLPNDKMVPKFRLHNRDCQLPLCRYFFRILCTTEFLNLLFQDGWKEVEVILGKIWNATRYSNKGQLHLELNFDWILEQHYFQGKYNSVSLKWDSALRMLDQALKLKTQISLLKTKDRDLVAPSMDEWDAAMVVFNFLKLLHHDSCHFLRCKCLTANMYFSRICGIRFKLLELQKCKYKNIFKMATQMKITFENYFEECGMVLAIASILDPREKCEYARYAFTKCYGMEGQKYLERIMNALNDIFDYYEKEFGKQELSSSVATNNGNSFTSYGDVSHYDELNWSWRNKKCHGRNKVASRKELEQYLADPCIDDVNDEFDILDWWRSKSQEFPTLRKMALDILRIPMSTDSNFRIGDMTKIIDPAFKDLHSDIIEAFICGKDWLDMSTNKTPTKEDEHTSSDTLNGEPTYHDPIIARLDFSPTNMDLMDPNGLQHDLHPCDIEFSLRPSTSQGPISQEPPSQQLPRFCINSTGTVPQPTQPNLDTENRYLSNLCFDDCTASVAVQEQIPQVSFSQQLTMNNSNPTGTAPQETQPSFGTGIGHQHGYPYNTPCTQLRSSTSQAQISQEALLHDFPHAYNNSTGTVPQPTRPRFDIGIGNQSDSYIDDCTTSVAAQVQIPQELFSWVEPQETQPNFALELGNRTT